MKFRPCIDIHNGRVKQIVGGSLADEGEQAKENFVAEQDAVFYAKFYRKVDLKGGHIILLNAKSSEYYEENQNQAFAALQAYPGGLQIGGGVTDKTAKEYLEHGASHVIVTSFVFQDGQIHYENLKQLVRAVGKEHLVLDLSCRKKNDAFYIVTDRWQKFTDVPVNEETLTQLSSYCSEFLVHAVDVEGKCSGIESELAALLGAWGQCPITYAGGVSSFEDLRQLKEVGRNRLDVTIGSALHLFGGTMDFQEVLAFMKEK